MSATPAPADTVPSSAVRRWSPLVVLCAAAAVFFALGLHQVVSFEALREHRHELMTFVATCRIEAMLAFVAA